MPKFRVWITRDTSESGTLEVDAGDEDEAREIAWQQYNGASTEDYAAFYEPDESVGEPYISDINELD